MKILQELIFLEDYIRLKLHPVLKDFGIPSKLLVLAVVLEYAVALINILL